MEKNNIINAVLEKISLSKLISAYIPLQKRGNNYLGLCPFHNEKTPSFSVVEDKGYFHCFGCKESGNALGFLMKIEHIPFKDALQKLAQMAGVVLDKNFEKRMIKEQKYKTLLEEINAKAALFYSQNLLKNPHSQAMNYLQGRKISKAMVGQFLLGFAPADAQFLVLNLKNVLPKGTSLRDVTASGLFFPAKDVTPPLKDRFRNKIIFPIQNEKNEILGFGSRVLDDSLPKYINSSETLLFKKKEILYGINFAKDSIVKKENVFITEGYFDVIAMHQFGFTNTVATLGTAFTPFHIEKLLTYTQNFTFLFDGDTAGLKAASKALQICLVREIAPKIVLLPQGLDPYDYLFNYGAEKFEELILERSFNWQSFLLKPIEEEGNPLKRQKIIKSTLETLRKDNPFLEKEFISVIANTYNIDVPTLENFLQSKTTSKSPFIMSAPIVTREPQLNINNQSIRKNMAPTSLKRVEELMVILFTYNPSLYSEYKDIISPYFFSTPDAKQIFMLFTEFETNLDSNAFIESLPQELKTIFTKVNAPIEEFKINAKKQIEDSYSFLRISFLREKIAETLELIKQAENINNKDSILQLMNELNFLKKEKEALEKSRLKRY